MNKRTPVYSLDCSDEHLLEGFELGWMFFIVQNVNSVMERFSTLIERSRRQSILRDVRRRAGWVGFKSHTILISHRSVIFVERIEDEGLTTFTLLKALERLFDIELEEAGDAWDGPGIVQVVFGSHRYCDLWRTTGLSGLVLPTRSGMGSGLIVRGREDHA